jgi:predicted nucleic acid-binding protein
LVDTNILLDVVTDDEKWFDWSVAQLDAAATHGPVLINAVIYAELSVRYVHIEELDKMVIEAGLRFAEIPRAALFLAGKAFHRYRTRGGRRTGVLPDFFIGAHAAIAGVPLLTRDPARFASYFPQLDIIAPDRPN